MLLEHDYIHADPPKPLPPIPMRVSRRSQLRAAFRQHARPIVIEDPELARPFARLLRARELRLWALGEFIADAMSLAIGRSYGANIEAHWFVGRYILPGNVQKVILKPKPYDTTTTATPSSMTIRHRGITRCSSSEQAAPGH